MTERKHCPTMSPAALSVVLAVATWSCVRGQAVLGQRSRQVRKKEEYSFESQLKRATEECSYIARNEDDDSHKTADLIQRIKNEMNDRKAVEFYEEREEDKKRSKQYYDNVERQVRRKVLSEGADGRVDQRRRTWADHRRRNNSRRERRPPPPLPQPLPAPLPPGPVMDRSLSPGLPRTSQHEAFPLGKEDVRYGAEMEQQSQFDGTSRRRPRSKEASFGEGTFKDHNNCFSRCVFARMELVDVLGFPQEAQLRKTLEDLINDRKVRSAKVRRVSKCFDDVKKVAIDDNCIYSTKIFKCMRLDEPGSRPW